MMGKKLSSELLLRIRLAVEDLDEKFHLSSLMTEKFLLVSFVGSPTSEPMAEKLLSLYVFVFPVEVLSVS